MHPGRFAQETPDKPAVVMAGSGETVSYAELDARSTRLARVWQQAGLRPGDHVALVAENHPRYFEVYWAAIRSGLYLTAVNRYLSADEAGYIVDDCGASALVVSHALRELAAGLVERTPKVRQRLMWDGAAAGHEPYEGALAAVSAEPLAAQPRGATMLYSSGTTGRPKGIRRPIPGQSVDDPNPYLDGLRAHYRYEQDMVYLSPAPLYHAAPLAFTTGAHAFGGTVVVMEHFDPERTLADIERFRATHSQFVPTMFVRMLKLPAEVRDRYDVSSLRVAVHAAAPCPVEVKRQMIEWWGPVLYEYYAATEGHGSTYITSEEWLRKPGSVGRAANGVLRICDESGEELPTGEIGTVYFERPDVPFAYHGDDAKTAAARNPRYPNRWTVGDVGYVDEDGYLFLTDRKAFMIISGGVNIYPQEIEDCLVMHPKVADVAVFGLPDEDMGERVQAVVQPAAGVAAGPDLEQELLAFARERIARYKVPRSVDFVDELPRLPTGKLYKRLLRDRYLQRQD